MARTRTPSNTRPKKIKTQGWARVTWDDLTAWTNGRSVQRGQTYQRQGRVRDLAISGDEKLLAWVQGTERYATTVELFAEEGQDSPLRSRCTCPVGYGCKHAVAVVLTYLEAIKQKAAVPEAADSDRRWKLLREVADLDEDEDFDEEWDDEEDLEESAEFEEEEEERPQPAIKRARKGAPRDEALRAFLEAKSQAELVEMLFNLAGRWPEFGEELREQQALHSGKTDKLVAQARKEIKELTSQDAWWNEWEDYGHVPDYSGLKRRLENLLEHGQADALLELGKELLQRGKRQVEESHDEGETATGITDCLDVVFQAVPRSSLSNPQKLLYVIDACLADEYDLCQGADEVLENGPWSPADWSAVADELKRRLASAGKPRNESDFTSRHRRDGLTNWLIDALDNANRSAEALAVCEAEARATGSYERLVRRLIAEDRLDDAVRWANEGIEKTQSPWPGIAAHLRELLREIGEKRKDWPLVAAYRAEEFFEQPGVSALQTLLKAAGKASCADQVRAAALRFLETGKRPAGSEPVAAAVTEKSPARKKPATQKGAAWPLPPVAAARPARPARPGFERSGPYFEVLLDLAIAEKRPDDVLAWYDKLRDSGRRSPRGYYGGESHDVRVADAVADSHPDRALAIYQKHAEALIAQTTPSAYEQAAVHLRKVRKLLHKLGRAREWQRLVAQIREENARKRRLLETLDRLEGRPIVEG